MSGTIFKPNVTGIGDHAEVGHYDSKWVWHKDPGKYTEAQRRTLPIVARPGNAATPQDVKSPAASGGGSGSGNSLMSLIKQAGFTGAAANTMYGIVMAESGGRADAHNGNASTGDDSYGLAQINMLGSMGPERRAAYGLKSNADLYDPLTNLKIAYQMSGGGTHFGDWTTYTSGAFRSFVGQNDAVVTTGGGNSADTTGSSPGGDAKVPKADYLDAFPDLVRLLTSIPELKGKLDYAIANNQGVQEFKDAIMGTTYWKTHAPSIRAATALKLSDPAAWKQKVDQYGSSVSALASQMGVRLSSQQIAAITHEALFSGLDGDQTWLTRKIGTSVSYKGLGDDTTFRGGMANAVDQLRTLYASYGLKASDAQFGEAARNIVAGLTSIDTYRQHAIKAAKSMFPGLGDQLDAGLTVSDAAGPYQQSMASLLEVDPATLDLNTPMIRQALQGTQGGVGQGVSGKTTTPALTPLWQFENQVRKDPRWGFTRNAHEQMATLTMQLGRNWGFE